MALRHIPRPSDRDRAILDPTQPPPSSQPPSQPLPSSSSSQPLSSSSAPPPPPVPPSHLNGTALNHPPGPLPNGAPPHPLPAPHHHHHPPSAIVSPTVPPPPPPNGLIPNAPTSVMQKLAMANEQTWLLIGRIAEQMGDLDHAQSAYENALRHNPVSLPGLTQVASIARIKENYPMAIDFFQRVLGVQEENGEIWSALGHCYLMQDDLQKAYTAYQQALYLLPNPKEDPKLWYGIGILYDRYGSLDHAEEAFSSVLRMDKGHDDLDFDKANEILFRLGIIYKQQGKYEESLTCFDRILRNPPSPLAHADIWFQIGHVYEQQKDHVRAKDAYERVVADNPNHAKVLQQLGWLYHQDGSSFQNQELAIQYLTKSLEADSGDAQSWYLLGRAYMAGQKYNRAYEAYQQAVYRDGRNPTFWCSIGVLYFQINQYRDALDAYSRAIRINPYISEVWFDLGSLYESCNNQISDAIDAYARASELDPANPVITQRLQLLKNAQVNGGAVPAAPGPQDVHPTAYAGAVVPPSGPLLLPGSGSERGGLGGRPGYRADSRGPGDPSVSLPPPSQVGARTSSPGPFRGGPPPPVVIDESRQVPSHQQLAPMDVDRPPPGIGRDYPPPRGGADSRGGSLGHQSLLLHHPVPQQQPPLPPASEDMRNGHGHGHGHGHSHSHSHSHSHPDPFYNRPPLRVPSRSTSPHPRNRSSPPSSAYQYPPPHPSGRQQQHTGPGQPSSILLPPHRSPRQYHDVPPPHPPHPPSTVRQHDHEGPGGWDRRGSTDYGAAAAARDRDWDTRRSRHGAPTDYPPLPPHLPTSSSTSHPHGLHTVSPASAPPPLPPQTHGPPASSHSHSPDRSPPLVHPPSRAHWDSKPPSSLPNPPSLPSTSRSPPHHHHNTIGLRYDPRHDGREPLDRDVGAHDVRSYTGSPSTVRHQRQPSQSGGRAGSESPHSVAGGNDSKDRRKRLRDKENNEMPLPPVPTAATAATPTVPAASSGSTTDQAHKRERKKRSAPKRVKEEPSTESPRPFVAPLSSGGSPNKSFGKSGGVDTPESGTIASASSSRSGHTSPSSGPPRAPARIVDEDYDEGVADVLMGLASGYRHPVSSTQGPGSGNGASAGMRSPPMSTNSRGGRVSPPPRSSFSHRGSVSSRGSQVSSPPMGSKRALSPASDESESKRARMEGKPRSQPRSPPSSSSAGGRTPARPSRHSPGPYRGSAGGNGPPAVQHGRSSEERQPLENLPYPPSPSLPVVLPPHPRPIGAGLSSHGSNNGSGGTTSNLGHGSGGSLPPIAILSPSSTVANSPSSREDDRMVVDRSRSTSPPQAPFRSNKSSLVDVVHPPPPRLPTGSPHSDKATVASPASTGRRLESEQVS